jgi:hypothetical protein
MPTQQELEIAKKFVRDSRIANVVGEDDELSGQLRAVLKAADIVRRKLVTNRDELASTGHFTGTGLAEALRNPVESALSEFNRLHGVHLEPRLKSLRSQLAALPQPVMAEVDPLERQLLLEQFTRANGADREQLEASALRDPRLAAALISVSPRVTRLADSTVASLRQIAEIDKHREQRSALQAQCEAIESVVTELDGLANEARSFLQ